MEPCTARMGQPGCPAQKSPERCQNLLLLLLTTGMDPALTAPRDGQGAYSSVSQPTAPISSKAEGLQENGASMVAHSQAGAKASVGQLSQEKRGCCWHLGGRQRRKAMCFLSGIAASPSSPACSQPWPRSRHTQPHVHLHLAGGAPGGFSTQEGALATAPRLP